ncbi:unnamed protein product [Oikopleura dioica]|uniref:Uncharacterized protein n=1 Tax=Oikopleura dioica TaxID=34765 RepID=E4X2I3_OIKDI|nr:unnamed protein product [Oikopleura dioica]
MHSAALPQSKNNLSDETDSELSDDTLAEQTLAIDSDSISQVKSPLMGYKDMSSKELWKTPKTMKICKSKERPSTIKSLSRNRSVSPVESIASSRGRRSLIRTKLNFDENSDDGSNTDDFFEETLSDYQPSSGSDKNNRNSADSKKKVSDYRKKTKSKDTDFEEDDHQRLDVSKSKSTKMKRGPYKKKSKHVRSKDDKNTSQAFISDEISSDSEIENNKTMSQRKNGRKIKRKESPLIRSEARDGLHSIASTSECTVSQEIDKISGIPELDELDVVESSDESNTKKVTTSLMSKKRFKKPWNLDSSEIMTSDDSDEAVQIDTESVNWMNEGELNDLEKDKSVFDNIESSETDSDVEEIEESVTSGKSKGVRKFSDWQKNKRKLLQEIVGWLPLNRNPVSILIETLRDKILKKEYDRIDDILKALMMKIGKSFVLFILFVSNY